MMKHTWKMASRWLCAFGLLAWWLCACSPNDETHTADEPVLVNFVLPGISGEVTPQSSTRAALDEGALVNVIAYRTGGDYSASNRVGSAAYRVGADGALVAVGGNDLYLPEGTYMFICCLNPTSVNNTGTHPVATVSRFSDYGSVSVSGQVTKWTTAEGNTVARPIQLGAFSRECARVSFKFSLGELGTSAEMRSLKIVTMNMTNLSAESGVTTSGVKVITPTSGNSVTFPVYKFVTDRLDPLDVSGSFVVLPKSSAVYSFDFGVQFNGVTTITNTFRTSTLPALAYEAGKEYTYTVMLGKDGKTELWLTIDQWSRHDWTVGIGGAPEGPISTQLLGYWDTTTWTESLGVLAPGNVGNVAVGTWVDATTDSVLGSDDANILK